MANVPPKVLIVDDDHSFLELVQMSMHPDTFRVASTLEEALHMVQEVPPTTVVLDLSLPDSSIERTLAKLRDFKEKAGNPTIIVISGHPESFLKERAMLFGADGFIEKDAGFLAALRRLVWRGPTAEVIGEMERRLENMLCKNVAKSAVGAPAAPALPPAS